MSNVITIDSTDCRLSGLSSDVASYLEQNVSPEDRRAVAELIQTTEQALGRASEALARIFLSLEASEVPELAEQFLAYLRGKGLSRQRLSCIRIAARTRAELQASSRLDSGLVSSLLSLGDDHLQVYSRLTDHTKEKAHAIIQAEGRISRQQLRQLQAEPDPVPFRVSPEPVQAALRDASPVEGVSVSGTASESAPALVAAPEPGPEPVQALAISEADPAPVSEPISSHDQVSAFPPIRGVEDMRDRIRSVGLNSYQILAAAIDVLKNREVNILYPHTRQQLERLGSIINTLDREYWHKMR